MRKLLVAAAATAMAVSATACSSSNDPGTTSGSTGTAASLSLAQIQAPASFVPGDLKSGPIAQFAQPVYDTLFRSDANAEPTANLATKWEYDAALTKLSLTLRDDVSFSDGTKLDGAAVKASLDKAKQGKDESGAQLKFISSVTAVDATHVDIVLSAPDPSLLSNLGGVAGMIASPKVINEESLKTTPVGSGPYTFNAGQSQAGSKYVYTRNENYWNKGAFPYNSLTLTVYNDNNALLNALRAGQVDGGVVTSKDVDSLKGAGLNVLSYPNGGASGLYIFDRQGKLVPALGDVRVRQALNHAFDRAAIVKQAFGGTGTPTTQIFNSGSVAYDQALDSKYPYDVAKAKQLLADAGYANGFELPMPDVAPVFPQQQAAVTEALTAIGIKPVFQPVNGQTFISDLLSGKFAATYFNLDNFRAWDTAQLALAPGALWNTFHVADPTIVDLITKAQAQTGDAQAATFKQLNQYVVDQAWFAPWVQPNNEYATSKKVNVTAQKFSSYPPIYNYKPAS